jgi:hypothetical protein
MCLIQDNGLRSRIYAAGCGDGLIEQNGNIQVKFILYFIGGKFFYAHHHHHETYLVAVLANQGFELSYVKPGAGAIGIKKMQKHRFALIRLQRGIENDQFAGFSGPVTYGHGVGNWYFQSLYQNKAPAAQKQHDSQIMTMLFLIYFNQG